MRFEAISATPNALGNRIDLAWKFPSAPEFPGVRVVRREGSHPTRPDDGTVVAHGVGIASAVDTGLKGETPYYYALFGFRNDPPEYDLDRRNRAAAIATSPNDHAGQLYALLPGVYHRYDTRLPGDPPPTMAEADKQRGLLRRFMDLPGSQFDLLYSFAKAALDLHDVQKADGRLLPLLADWIGWKTDNRLEYEAQRNEIRQAPFMYKTVGLKPTIEATVKRISGWESRTKEFVHNVFRSNNPERLNLWAMRRDAVGTTPAELFSLDFAYEGRPAAVRDGNQVTWFFYHTYKSGRWEIWYKQHVGTSGWGPSQPLPQTAKRNSKYPAAALAGGTPWVFWTESDGTTATWRLVSSLWDGTRWSEPQPLPFAVADPREPAAFVDNTGNVWLLWFERVGQRRQLRYSRHDGASWGAPVTFPLDAGDEPRVEADLFALFDAATTRIWVFWSREIVLAGDQTRREIAYRVKADANFDDASWGSVNTLPRPLSADYHDRQPAALIDTAGAVELFWASNRDAQGYGVWHSSFDEATDSWSAAQRFTVGGYTERDPLPVPLATELWLVFRCNRSLSYPSSVYAATVSTDFRYAGSTTVHTADQAKIALRGKYEDFAAYTYDLGPLGQRTNDDWYARDTSGVYLVTDTLDPTRVSAGVERLKGVLGNPAGIPGNPEGAPGEFVPLTDRVVFITAADRHDDYVYTYSAPGVAAPLLITESYVDALTTVAEEVALGPGEDFSDALE